MPGWGQKVTKKQNNKLKAWNITLQSYIAMFFYKLIMSFFLIMSYF